MSLTDSERDELKILEEKFGGCSSYNIEGNVIYSKTFHPEMVEEDEKYDYLGKIDDTSPGVRLHRLGTLKDYERYEMLRKKV